MDKHEVLSREEMIFKEGDKRSYVRMDPLYGLTGFKDSAGVIWQAVI